MKQNAKPSTETIEAILELTKAQGYAKPDSSRVIIETEVSKRYKELQYLKSIVEDAIADHLQEVWEYELEMSEIAGEYT
jgi:hypothetical protein